MKNVILGVLAVVFLAACCFPIGVPQAAAFESPLFESPLYAAGDSPLPTPSLLPTSTSVFPVIVLPTVTPKPLATVLPLPTMPPLGSDAPIGEPEVFRVLVFPIQGGD